MSCAVWWSMDAERGSGNGEGSRLGRLPAGFQLRKRSNQNIVNRLRERQLALDPTSLLRHNYSFYCCIVPNHTEQGVQPPAGFLRKFSPHGQFLLAFSNDQRNVIVYDYRGASAGQGIYHKNQLQDNIQCELFGCFFKLRYSIPVAANGEHLNRECSLFTEDCQHVLVVSSAHVQEDLPMFEVFGNNESVSPNPQFPLEDYTLYVVDIVGGVVSDSRVFKCDKINLSHNQGLSLCNSRLAVLSIQQQTIHLFQIINGNLVELQQIGRFCYPDDPLVYSEVYTQSPAETAQTSSATAEHPFLEKCYTSLKHRLLCFILKEAENLSSPMNRSPLENFFRKFTFLSSLRLGKMQLLDESHLLLKYSSEDVVTLKQSDSSFQPSLYVFYNLDTTEILSVHENTSAELLRLYEAHMDYFRSPVSHQLCRNTSSLSNNTFSRALHLKFKQTITSAKYGGSREAMRRLLTQLPVCAQSFSSSPYLDLSLYSYDDKWVSMVERPKPCGDNPVK